MGRFKMECVSKVRDACCNDLDLFAVMRITAMQDGGFFRDLNTQPMSVRVCVLERERDRLCFLFVKIQSW